MDLGHIFNVVVVGQDLFHVLRTTISYLGAMEEISTTPLRNQAHNAPRLTPGR